MRVVARWACFLGDERTREEEALGGGHRTRRKRLALSGATLALRIEGHQRIVAKMSPSENKTGEKNTAGRKDANLRNL